MKSIFPKRWSQILCLLAGLYAVAVALYIFIETGRPSGARDFHQFWYAGHFVIQGHDPYEAFYAGEQPQLPVKYLDGVTVDQYPVAQENLALVPVNTPVMVLLLTPFAFFSWNVAKWMFVVVNLALMLATGWLVLRRIPFGERKLVAVDELLLFLIYFDLSATRIAIENGQTTLLVFLCMLLALVFAKRSWQIGGLALGVALSKYSVSLPIFLFLIYKRNFKLLLLAVIVQVLGVIGLAAIASTSPLKVAMENVRLFIEIFSQAKVYLHLASQFLRLTSNPLLIQIPVIAMTLLVFVACFFWMRGRKATTPATNDMIDFHILTILFIWTVLAGYHRIYDSLILFFFLVLVFKGLTYPNIWKLKRRGKIMLMLFMAGIPLLLILPARFLDQLIPHYYEKLGDGVISGFFILMMVVSMFLLRRYLQNRQPEPVSERVDSYDLPIELTDTQRRIRLSKG